MRKIGILTYIKEYSNHGTNMQSYSTLKAIQNAFPGDRVELINYSGWKPLMKPYFSSMTISSLMKDFVRILKYKKFFKEDLVLSKNKLISANLTESLQFINEQNYDAIYVGSDTLLELKRSKNDEITAYWLDASVKSKKFLIAASANNVVYEGLTDGQKSQIQNTVNDFTLLGVRDEPTHRLISHFTSPEDTRLHLIPDPTFTYDIDYSYIEKYMERKQIKFQKPVVCLHLVRSTGWGKELANYFKSAGYTVVSFRPAHYADYILSDLSAFEQAGVYRYFDLVITHRFHDSIFSIKNITPVIFFPEHEADVTSYKESKTLTLFKSLGIESTNYLGDRGALNAKLIFDIHRAAIEHFKSSEPFIRKVLVDNKNKYESFLKASAELV